jgi:FlaA1/EpsC-like NDP-sugar epimerase
MNHRAKTFFLFIGDIIALYAALFLTLTIHYGGLPDFVSDANVAPFSIIFIVWLVIFFIAGLYDLRRLRNNLDFVKSLWLTILTSAIASILIFYAIPAFFGITPKTNLFIFVIVFGIIETFWRRGFNRTVALGEAPNRVLLIGNGAAKEVEQTIRENAQLGYEVRARMDESAAEKTPEALQQIVNEKNIQQRDFSTRPAEFL